MDADSEFETLVLNQRLELLTAHSTQSDLELAFNLQMQEAITASLSLQPSSSSSSSSPPPPPEQQQPDLITLQTQELDRFVQQTHDNQAVRSEMHLLTADLRRMAHDRQLAREIDQMDDSDWEEYGDNYEKPVEEKVFRLYFKGMESGEHVGGEYAKLAGVGVAVCDPEDRLVFNVSKAVSGAGASREVLEVKALIEGLSAVCTLEIKKVDVFFDYRTLFNHVTGKWIVKQQKVANLINQVALLQRKLDQCRMFMVPRCSIQFAFKLARDAIDSQITRRVELNGKKDVKETCNICFEDTDSSHMFTVDSCFHRFCFSCMQQHVEVKLRQAMIPVCPHVGCNNRLNVESCRKFLSTKLLDMMIQRIKEESIPVTEKIYCPYPKCSALMSISEAIRPQEGTSKQLAVDTFSRRKCIKCLQLFCINCKVPWHEGMFCNDYKRFNPHKQAEELKLKVLARQKLWRQCVKCNHMIELAEGCFHMTCRCGYEFCYTCGAEWKNKKPTCSCPLWDEHNIVYEDSEDEEFDEYHGDGDFDNYVEYGIPHYYL